VAKCLRAFPRIGFFIGLATLTDGARRLPGERKIPMGALPAKPGQTVFLHPLVARGETSRQSTLVKTSQVEVIQLIVPAGRDVPTHKVQGELVVHCLQGEFSLTALGNTYELKSGQLLHLLIDQPFSIRAIEDSSLLVTIVAAKTGGSIELIGS
jgi:quercetin dioxygenase-like cupin family protein